MANQKNVLIKGLLSLLSILILSVSASVVSTPESVVQFYKGMTEMAAARDQSVCDNIGLKMRSSFVVERSTGSSSGINVPNDFRFFEYDKERFSTSHNDKELTTFGYVNRLETYLFEEKIMRVTYSIGKTEYSGDVPEMVNTRLTSSAAFLSTIVNKTFTINGKEQSFVDTVRVDIPTMRIRYIANGIVPESVTGLYVDAATAYRQGMYGKAYKLYDRIIKDHSEESNSFLYADSMYRLALMTYYQKGTEGVFTRRSGARSKGKEYMNSVIDLSKRKRLDGNFISLNEKANNVLHNWMYTNL